MVHHPEITLKNKNSGCFDLVQLLASFFVLQKKGVSIYRAKSLKETNS